MTIDATGVTNLAGLLTAVTQSVSSGGRFAGLYGTAAGPDGLRLTALLADGNEVTAVDAAIDGTGYPSLTPIVPAAFWYERVIHDLFGTVPHGHPRLDPLVLPLSEGADRPRPGAPERPELITPDEHTVRRRVVGTGLFTIPHGPVRSGVTESVEYLVETPGEDIPFLRLRPFYKHRGVEKHFETMTVTDGIRLAERVEGIATIAHACAYAHAMESLAGVTAPPAARYLRLIYAELERITNHLDVIGRLAEAAGLAVAIARFGWHKERVLRTVGAMCGSRFGRGVVVCGGVSTPPRLSRTHLLRDLGALRSSLDPDIRLLMGTSSFLDRLRRTGPLPASAARTHGALGPVGRASGVHDDTRTDRGYGAYPTLGVRRIDGFDTADALARLRVRIAEIDESFRLIDAAIEHVNPSAALTVPVEAVDGRGIGWAEAPQGEVVYAIDVDGGRISRCFPRTASLHNMAVFGTVFTGDVLTDFPFIEASFGSSIAGVAL